MIRGQPDERDPQGIAGAWSLPDRDARFGQDRRAARGHRRVGPHGARETRPAGIASSALRAGQGRRTEYGRDHRVPSIPARARPRGGRGYPGGGDRSPAVQLRQLRALPDPAGHLSRWAGPTRPPGKPTPRRSRTAGSSGSGTRPTPSSRAGSWRLGRRSSDSPPSRADRGGHPRAGPVADRSTSGRDGRGATSTGSCRCSGTTSCSSRPLLRPAPRHRGGSALLARGPLAPVGDHLLLGRDLRRGTLVQHRVQVRVPAEAHR